MVTRPTPTSEQRRPSSATNGASTQRPRRSREDRRAEAIFTKVKSALASARARLPDLRADMSCYAEVQRDRVKLMLAQAMLRLALAFLLLISLSVVVANSVSVLLAGIAGGVTEAIGGNPWLANVITGGGSLLLLGVAILLGLQLRRSARMRRLHRVYARAEARQAAAVAEAGKRANRNSKEDPDVVRS
ncbi:MAG: hypothetical protein ABL997_19385 [Planctomycetota bacterium]